TSKKFGITDYNNRIITIDKATLKSHTNTRYQKYRTRHLYLSEVENILTAPDEVWLQNYRNQKYQSFIYLKYYNDQAVVVVCTLTDSLELKIETWHKLDDTRLRRGMLIKN